MHLLLTLLLGHLFADFPLQTNRLAKWKRHSLIGVLVHVLIYMTVTALLLEKPFQYWPLLIGLTSAHFLIDWFKMVCSLKSEVQCFVLDQLLHLSTVLLATYLAHQVWFPAPVGILPNTVLFIAFLCALTLAVMVLGWIWTNGLSEEQINRHIFLHWVKYQMLAFEQRVGLLLIIVVFLGQRIR